MIDSKVVHPKALDGGEALSRARALAYRERSVFGRVLLAACGSLLAASPGMVGAQSADDANKSNNPLTPAPSFNLQDYYSPELFGLDE